MKRISYVKFFLVCLTLLGCLFVYTRTKRHEPPAVQGVSTSDAQVTANLRNQIEKAEGSKPGLSSTHQESGSALTPNFSKELKKLAERSQIESRQCEDEGNGEGFFRVHPESSLKALRLMENGIPPDIDQEEFFREFGNLGSCGNPTKKMERFRYLIAQTTGTAMDPSLKDHLCQNLMGYLSDGLDSPIYRRSTTSSKTLNPTFKIT